MCPAFSAGSLLLLPSTGGVQNTTQIQFPWLTSVSPICPSAAIRNAAVSGRPHGIHATDVLGIPPRSRVGNTVDTGNISFRKYYGRGLLRPETETVNGRGERCQPYFMSVTLGLDLRGKNNFPQKRKSPKRNHA